MKIDLLFFDECPSWQQGLQNLMAALEAEGLEAEIRMAPVENNADAASLKFLGSPSFHINGEDLWPEQRAEYALSLRVYATPQGMQGAPTVEMLREKLRAVRK